MTSVTRDVPGLVTVVIPAFNAATTLDETLESARAQTYRDLEIIIVDDGSGDATPEIAARHASADPRVRVIAQNRKGVAAARNAGVEAAHGAWVAPLDADDLWHPQKIEKQMAATRGSDAALALVYTWRRLIDETGQSLPDQHAPRFSGDVLRALLGGDFIGTGSSPLILRAALRAMGGYDTTLKEADGQGCEDWDLYVRLAEHYRFAVVAEPLTLYRIGRAGQSADPMRMVRLHDRVAEGFRQRFPAFHKELGVARRNLLVWLWRRASLVGAAGSRRRAAFALLTRYPLFCLRRLFASAFKASS